MSLNFYADSALTLRMTTPSPKRFLVPDAGGTKTSQLYLGDPYFSLCTVHANPGDGTLNLADTSEFMTAAQIAGTSGGVATAVSGTNTFTYTGKTQSTLTGVVGITADIFVDDQVRPDYIYSGIGGANLEAYSAGTDILNYGIRIALGATQVLGYQGFPAILPQTQIGMGVANALPVYMSIKVPAGVDQVFTNLAIQMQGLYQHDSADLTAFPGTGAVGPTGPLYAYRHDEELLIPIRVLPLNRQVQPNAPGFIVGQYRWRGDADRNATAIVPTVWGIDPNTVGLEKFIAGIGDEDDLTPEQLLQDSDSVRMQIHRGEYFTGANRYYVPADWNLEFFPSSLTSANMDGTVTIVLSNTPRVLAPIFVGTYILDNQQYYEKSIEYLYQATLKNPDGSARTDLPPYYYTLDRLTKTITLNKSIGHPLVFLGAVSGQSVDYFDLPVYPVSEMDVIYVDRGASIPPLYASSWIFDEEQGTLQLPNIAGSLQGQPLFAICSPAVAVLYDSGPDDVREIDTVDFNPAFSGLASGYFYLLHKRQRPASLVLSCDKPQIPIPASQASIIGLVAYGPVYFENDYALLTVTAYSSVPGETVPNAKLDVVVSSMTFTGTLNYEDPLAQTVSVITGGDGTANLIYLPKGGFGVWLPTIPAAGGLGGLATTNITDDTLVLAADIPLGQIWNPQEGWLVTTYTVIDNDPLLGMVGGNPALGQVPWITSGTPGGTDYKTNGERDAWRVGNTDVGQLVRPIDALDSVGRSYTNSLFNGSVHSLVYSTTLPMNTSVITNIGAYFLTFIQRVLIKMQLENSNLFSNSILLQMDTPQVINENPWLILNDAIQGRLNQYRLGYTPPTT